MSLADGMGADVRRSDYLLSVAVTDCTDRKVDIAMVRELAQTLMRSHQFWEVLAVARPKTRDIDALAAKLKDFPNIRIIEVAEFSSFYGCRIVAAEESIGDVVVLTTPGELRGLEVVALADKSRSSNRVVVCSRDRLMLAPPIISTVLSMLTGYDVNQRDRLTGAYPREHLTRLLQRSDAEIALRFQPRSQSHQTLRFTMPRSKWRPRNRIGFSHRASLVWDLAGSSAPRMLSALSLFAGVAAIGAFSFFIYAVTMYLTLTNIAPGWLTTSLLLSSSTFFLAIAVGGLALGARRILDLLSQDRRYSVLREINNTDLFGTVTELNVEHAADDAGSPSEVR